MSHLFLTSVRNHTLLESKGSISPVCLQELAHMYGALHIAGNHCLWNKYKLETDFSVLTFYGFHVFELLKNSFVTSGTSVCQLDLTEVLGGAAVRAAEDHRATLRTFVERENFKQCFEGLRKESAPQGIHIFL